MELKEQLQLLDELSSDRQRWSRTTHINSKLNAFKLRANVGELQLVISCDDCGTEWAVENTAEERMVSNYWKPAASIKEAMRECTDFARAYLHTIANPQHLEA
ncbi:MAG: hypothetical protein JNL05_13065 [Flavobacteriales bacterium]|nr:hypothetical protein [Flavobacteriales bacterium]